MADIPENNPTPTRRSPAEPVSRKTRRWTLIIIGLLVAVWCIAMYYRMEIRAYWWARQLGQVTAPEQQTYYLRCLASIKNKAAGAAIRMTRNPDPRTRELGVAVLRNCTGPKVDQTLIRLLSDPGNDVADAAAMALTDPQRGSDLALIPRLQSIISKGGRQACEAVLALQRVRGEQTETMLADALAHTDDPDLLAQLMDSLGMIGSRIAVPQMIARLDDTRPVRPTYSERSAVRALAGARSQFMAKGLDSQQVLATMPQSRTVADVALRSLQLIAGGSAPRASTSPANDPSPGTLRQKWEEWWKTNGELRMKN